MDRLELFHKELGFISNDNIKKFVEEALLVLPEYFFIAPASSTGKHHPAYALGEGGLIRHTKAAVGIAIQMLRLEMYNINPLQRDIIIASLILHDGYKANMETHEYILKHPIAVCDYLEQYSNIINCIDEHIKKIIFSCIKSHMGEWNKDKEGNEILPKPKTSLQKFVHLCDYLASRKCLEYNFEAVE